MFKLLYKLRNFEDKKHIINFYRNNNDRIYWINNNKLYSHDLINGIYEYTNYDLYSLIIHGYFKDKSFIPKTSKSNNFTKVFTSIEEYIFKCSGVLYNDMINYGHNEIYISNKLFQYYNNIIMTESYDKKYLELIKNQDLLGLYLHPLSRKLYIRTLYKNMTIRNYCYNTICGLMYNNNIFIINKIKSLDGHTFNKLDSKIVYLLRYNYFNFDYDKSIPKYNKYLGYICHTINKFDTVKRQYTEAADIYVLIQKLIYNKSF